MPVTTILLLRHGHRLAWTLDPTTGKYTSSHPFPTKLPADPPLASHGVRQAQETGRYLAAEEERGNNLAELARQGRLRIYSSLFYRCLETLRPTVELLRQGVVGDDGASKGDGDDDTKRLLRGLEVRGERGFGEWFGKAWFEQPRPAEPGRLKADFYPWLDEDYKSLVVPDLHGERIAVLHERVARALAQVVRDVDAEFEGMGRGMEEVTLLVCGHAAQIICAGRALTGLVPEDYDEEDFYCFTCGISKFVRRRTDGDKDDEDWKSNGGGVAGGWDCVLNSDCSHLSQGEERGWHFHGDESFDSYDPGQKAEPRTSDGVVLGSHRKKIIEDTNEGNSKL